MYFIVGLGNPGKKYEKTRHNLGKRVVDKLMQRLDFVNRGGGVWRRDGGKETLIVIRQRGFMNESGEELIRVMKEMGTKKRVGYLGFLGSLREQHFLKKSAAGRLIVVHDDIDLALGKIRIRFDGGSAGHKGVESIIRSLGRADFWRVRLGIGRPALPADRPSLASEADQYVLSEFANQERDTAEKMVDSAAAALVTLVTEGAERAMNEYNK